MPDAVVLAFVLAAAAAAALVARLAFVIGGRGGLSLLIGGFSVLAVANLVMMPFTDPARIASGAALGFVIGAVVGLVRFGAPFTRRPGDGRG
ncbi:hypothetical protein [Cellulomonas sp. ATA003]|uniref:hypothetical protein n=1 Tax=Cellulomonas sp. ATA003 TaxID=3073064 RepID=UPI0028731AF6|nr:hypothetical protein [Cellulomonas sp. ATA003]WNB85703.1 hypothetical protein REH70_19715 [Cellulomonas sp. ATA003]